MKVLGFKYIPELKAPQKTPSIEPSAPSDVRRVLANAA